MPILTYPATTPSVVIPSPTLLSYKTGAVLQPSIKPSTTPSNVGVGASASTRPATGQVYPRGDQ